MVPGCCNTHPHDCRTLVQVHVGRVACKEMEDGGYEKRAKRGFRTRRKSLCFLCPNRYPFPTGFSENTWVYAPAFGTIAAKILRINPDPKKNARDLSGGRSGYRLGVIRGPLGISLGIYPEAARELAWDFSGGRLGDPQAYSV